MLLATTKILVKQIEGPGLLENPVWNTLKLRLEIAHSAAEAAAVEARRRVR
jgi:hypothetical protein